MFRLRAVEGLTLEEIAVRHGLHRERVRRSSARTSASENHGPPTVGAKHERKHDAVAGSEDASPDPGLVSALASVLVSVLRSALA